MSDQYDDYEDNEPGETSTIQQLRAQLKDQAARLKELEPLKEQAERTPDLERRLAFYEADLPRDLNETQRKAIIATAETADPDGYRQAAQNLGFIESAAPTAPVEELDAIDRIANGSTGANGVDPANYEAEVASAANPDELRAVMAKYGRTPQTVE